MSAYIKDVIERVVRTAIQAGAAAVLAVWIEAGSFDQIDWTVVWQVFVFAAGASLLMALAAKPIGDPNSASVLPPS
jgi:Zn finger protein HypA/HybF involved in hydrogenase expression